MIRKSINVYAIVVAFAFPAACLAQGKADQVAMANMKSDVVFLADDKLMGRETGTEGERMAAEYIANRFQALGLQPLGDDSTYLQEFDFNAPPVLGEKNRLQVGRKEMKLGDDFYPVSFSGTGSVLSKLTMCLYGIHAPDLNYDDLEGKEIDDRVVAISVGSPDGIHPHSKYLAHHDLQQRVNVLVERGAKGIILYNDDATAEDPSAKLSALIKPATVPVVFMKGEGLDELLVTNNPVALTVDVIRAKNQGYNVVGFVDNGQDKVVVLGAHYDHLGMGDGGSLYRGEPAVHNGADDNASGVAVMTQIVADLIADEKAKHSDYLLIAFSGEEKGLFGSKHWTSNPTIPLDEINYMLNYDMVGRLDSTETISINGVGTSPSWEVLENIKAGELAIKTTKSGIGASDHSSFYHQGIPAIHFFTGAHSDYHKPSDDEELINYEGMLRICRFTEELISELGSMEGELEYTKSAEESGRSAPRFTVTLGVIPDYLFDEGGMRIDGVTDGKPAANAGLIQGDVVVKLGDFHVHDMMSYMDALSKFKKGDATTVEVERGEERKTMDIQF